MKKSNMWRITSPVRKSLSLGVVVVALSTVLGAAALLGGCTQPAEEIVTDPVTEFVTEPIAETSFVNGTTTIYQVPINAVANWDQMTDEERTALAHAIILECRKDANSKSIGDYWIMGVSADDRTVNLFTYNPSEEQIKVHVGGIANGTILDPPAY